MCWLCHWCPAPCAARTAEVSATAYLGDATQIWNEAQVRDGARIGSQCMLGKGVYIDVDVTIGDRVKLENRVSVFRGARIASGAFVGPITWTLVSQTGQRLTFQLTGGLAGTNGNGNTVSGTTTQTFHTTVAQLQNGIVHITSGHTQLTAAPEPGTLGLIGLGLLGIGRKVRRKMLVSSNPA